MCEHTFQYLGRFLTNSVAEHFTEIKWCAKCGSVKIIVLCNEKTIRMKILNPASTPKEPTLDS